MKYRMKALWSFLACLALILIPGPVKVHAESIKREQVTITQFGKERFLLYLPLYVAIEEGLFDKRGIDVDLKFAGADDQVFAAVAKGNADFGIGDPGVVALSHDKGGPGKVVAMTLTNLAIRGVTNNDAVPIVRIPKDLEHMRVSSLPAPSPSYSILDKIKTNNDLNSLTIVPTPPGSQIGLLEAGKIDIATDIEPNISIYVDKGYRPVLDLSIWTEPQALAGLMTTEDIIKKRPQTVQKVVSSLQEALYLMFEDPEVSYRVAQKMYPQLSDKIIHNAVDSLRHRRVFPRSIALDDGIWQRTIRAHLEIGDLKKPQALSVSVDNSFAIRARRELNSPQSLMNDR